MTALFCDSCDHYNTAQILRKYDANSGFTISSGRRNTSGLRASNWSNSLTKILSLGSISTLVVGFAFKANTLVGDEHLLVSFLSGASVVAYSTINDAGRVKIYDASDLLLASTPNLAVTAGKFQYIELYIGAGLSKISINGADPFTDVNGASGFDRIKFLGGDPGSVIINIDDIYVCDGLGSINNDLLGARKVIAIGPVFNGAENDWLSNPGFVNYSNVDETIADDDTTVVQSVTIDDKDLYKIDGSADIDPPDGPVNFIQTDITAKESSFTEDDFIIQRLIRDAEGPTDYILTTDYQIFEEVSETDPLTFAPWTKEDLLDCEFGVIDITGAQVVSPGPQTGIRAVDFSTQNFTSDAVTTVYSWAHETTDEDDRLLIVAIEFSRNSTQTITGVTYNGVALTLIGVATESSFRTEMWYLVAPAVGSHNIQFTMSAATALNRKFVGIGYGLAGINQSTPLGTSNTANNTSVQPATVTVFSSIGEVIIGSFVRDSGTTDLALSCNGQTEVAMIKTGTSGTLDVIASLGAKAAAASSTSICWDFNSPSLSANWAVVAVPVRAA